MQRKIEKSICWQIEPNLFERRGRGEQGGHSGKSREECGGDGGSGQGGQCGEGGQARKECRGARRDEHNLQPGRCLLEQVGLDEKDFLSYYSTSPLHIVLGYIVMQLCVSFSKYL